MEQAKKRDKMTIVCFSHLSWDSHLFQRPQQLMSRFSNRFNVLYVNSDSFRQSFTDLFRKKRLYSYNVSESLVIYSPFTLPTFQNKLSLMVKLNRVLFLFLVRKRMEKLKFDNTILWIYHPRFLHTIGKFEEKLIVYDCMDDFTSLLSIHEDRERNETEEQELLRMADIAFAGGYSIADLKKSARERIHVFPSAVDTSHFSKAISENLEIPDDIKDIPHPILGYWGAIDDRIDHDLLKKIAVKSPDRSIVLLGPIVSHRGDTFYLKSNQFKNIYWLGAKDYSLLPNYAKTFDVCLNPFVLTREGIHLSPTKTLEYLATGKPVVSTPIPDVVKFYDGVVKIANGADEFDMAVKSSIEEDSELMKQKRIAFTACKTWDNTVEQMERLILDIINTEKNRMGSV